MHLPLALVPMRDIAGEHRLRIVDYRPMAGSSRARAERLQPRERRQILAKVAAAAGVDHHAAAENDEIAGEYRAARLVPERDVIGRVSGVCKRDELVAAGVDRFVVRECPPADVY